MLTKSLFVRKLIGVLFILLLLSSAVDAQLADDAKVYVVGNVLNPAALSLKKPLTVTQAISIAGGALTDKKNDNVRIVRVSDKGQITTCVSLRAIKKRRVADLQLQDSDILDVTGGKCARPMYWEAWAVQGPRLRLIK